jgi:hypothetical protein
MSLFPKSVTVEKMGPGKARIAVVEADGTTTETIQEDAEKADALTNALETAGKLGQEIATSKRAHGKGGKG